MQTCLENRSIQERHDELAASMYQNTNGYDASHPNALADGDSKGKGTGSSGHTHSLPNCNIQPNVFDYSNFATDISFNAGNSDDRNARIQALTRTLFTQNNPYSANMIDTSLNVLEGQFTL